jgi:hypothetical protein
MADCILRHDCDFTFCSLRGSVCAWDDYDYSAPETKLVKSLAQNTNAKIIERKFPGILVELEDGSQYWICEWDVHEIGG